MSNAASRRTGSGTASLSERFWSIARAAGGTGVDGDSVDPVRVVRHVLSILDALDRGESGAPVSVRTVSFLKLLRESEQRGDMSYAAPEQITGEVLDERSLVFSVGVLLFERLTGRHPFGAEGNHVRRVARIRKGEFGSGVNYFPTVPQGLRTILMKAMGPFPEERWTSLAELRSHLEQFVEQSDREPPRLPGTTAGASEQRPNRRSTKPKSDSESTRIVDMGPRVRSELLALAERKRRDHDETSGLIEATPAPKPKPVAVEPKVETTPLPSAPRPVMPAPAMPAAPTRPRGGSIVEADLLPELPRPDYVPNLKPAAPSSLKPLIYIGIGAALASVIFFVLSSGDGGTQASGNAAAPAATEPAAAAAPAPAATAEPVPAAANATAGAAPAAAAEPAALPPPSAEFDPEDAGNRALSKATSCLTDEQLQDGVEFGVGILLDGAGRVRKVYFAGEHSALPYKQRKCMQQAMVGAPVTSTVPEDKLTQYHARINASGIHVKAR